MGADDGQCPNRSPRLGLACGKRVGHLLPHLDPKRRIVWGEPTLGDHEVALPDDTEPERPHAKSHGPATAHVEWSTDLVNRVRTAGGLMRVLDKSVVTRPRRSDLAIWWRDLAEQEIARTAPKAQEYGSTDLIRVGRHLAATAGRQVSDEEAAELGVFFYLEGKLARWADAVARGQRPSDDTVFDIGVYVRMAQRIRATGGWPNGSKEAK